MSHEPLDLTLTGLDAGTKYTVHMQAKDGEGKLSKVTKVSATTAKYAAVAKDNVKQSIIGQVTFSWKDSTKNGSLVTTGYEVGFWVGKAAIFNQQDYENLLASNAKQKDKDTATAIWAQIGKHIGTPITAKTITFDGVTQKITFAVRATAEVDGTFVKSAVAKIAVTPLKYPAPATLTQPTPGTMTFNWTAPKNVTLPNVTTPEVMSITYTIGLYNTKQKKFTGTTATTFIEEIEGLTTDALSGVTAKDKVGVMQVIKFTNGNVVKSAVKVVTVK